MPSATRDSNIGNLQLDATERLIRDVFQQILDLPHVPDDADFFDLGGDSLQAARALTRIGQLCGAQLPLRALFDAPNARALAAAVLASQPISLGQAAKPETTRRPSSLSFSQERMWFMHALASASAAYHVPLALRLRGDLDVSALQRALERIVQRHDVLRTTFVGYSSGVSARIAKVGSVHVNEVVFHRRGGHVDVEQIRTYLSEFTNGTFDLEKGPLLRAVLVQMAPHDAVLLLVAHHIVADQWSLDVITRELAGYYGLETGRCAYEPPPLPRSYSAYAHWHRQWFESQRRETEIAYWKRKLADLEPLVLNTDFPRPPQQSFRGAKLRLAFDPGEIAALTRFAASQRCTLALVLMTALKVLLARHTQQTDVAIGVPVANRHHAESEALVGTLVNTLVLRTDLGDDPTFTDALRRVRETLLEGLEHQDTPFEAIVKELQIPRDASRSPLFSVLFNMLNTPLGAVRFAGLEWSRFDFDKKASQFDLTVTIDAMHDRSICFEYSQDLFAPATIEHLADHYLRLLRAVIAAPATPIASLSMMGDEERQLLERWSNGRIESEPPTTIVDSLRETCARQPGSIALTIDEQNFTYRELGEASDRIAAVLRARGIGRGERVGLCLHRSAQLVIAQWAVLKAGAAYVPLDPSYPRERLTFMASDARLAVLITEPALALELGWTEALCPTLDIDAELAANPLPVADAAERPQPSDTAYVIYTSGSTGQPKGVVISHKAVANFLRSMACAPGMSASDCVLAITTLSFDIAVLELLLPWSLGARVVMATQDQVTDTEALRRMIVAHEITLMQATPSTWRMLTDAGWSGSARLRALVGGEPLTRELATSLLAQCRDVWNMYGPTETTVWSTCWKVEAPQRTGISLGRPIANTQVYVLDEAQRVCPIGVPGEICIGGSGLADGYFDRPELTSERFIVAPFAAESARLYRTGDRGRWRHDGALEHLGRLDTQVKVRGHRIELEEIESQLARHTSIRRALVTTHASRAGDVRLIAYVVPNGAMPEAAVLRAFLRERLPDYMLPQRFVPLASIPTLPNGKTDLKRLPPPQQDAPPTSSMGEPRTATERALCAIWRDVLQLERIGIHDNFFDLGGHSILTVRLVSRIRIDLRRACTLPMVFRNPTVATLAAALESASALEGNSLIPLQPHGADPPLFCICGVQIYQELANRLAPDVPVYGVFVPLEMEYLAPTQERAPPTVERLAAEYLQTIRARQPHGPYRLLGFSFGGVLAYEMAQQLRAAGEEVAFLAILDSDVPDRRRRARESRLEQRLRTMKQRLGRRLKGEIQRLANGASAPLGEARDEKYLAAMRAYAAAPYDGRAIYVQAIDAVEYNPGYGWSALVPELQSYRIPGDHLGILVPPNVDLLVAKLQLHLER